MPRRIPWSLLLGVGAGLLLLRASRRRKRRWGPPRSRVRPSRQPEVVRLAGPTPVEAGWERPVATGLPDPIPGRTVRGAAPPHARGPEPVRFEPVVPDAPEEQDPAAEPRPVDPDVPAGSPVAPVVRRHR